MTTEQLSNYWDELVNNNIATNDEIALVTDINGFNADTLNDILYARTGNCDWAQYCDENGIENIVD